MGKIRQTCPGEMLKCPDCGADFVQESAWQKKCRFPACKKERKNGSMDTRKAKLAGGYSRRPEHWKPNAWKTRRKEDE